MGRKNERDISTRTWKPSNVERGYAFRPVKTDIVCSQVNSRNRAETYADVPGKAGGVIVVGGHSPTPK
jgi:hypothetical protein